MARHAWSMSSLEPGKDYELPSFAVPPGKSPPTFRVRLNDRSLRERAFADRPAEGIPRVIAIGDSTTFGTGVEVGERFTEHLGRALGERVEVLNAGRAGMTSQAALEMIEQRAAGWQPSVIIFGAMTNDIRDPQRSQRERAKHDLAGYEARVTRLIRLCERSRIGLVMWANTIAHGGRDPLAEYRAVMLRLGRRHDVPVVDLDEVYRRRPATAQERQHFLANDPWTGFWTQRDVVPLSRAALHMDWAHPNAAGHARLAKALLPGVRRALETAAAP